MIDGMPESVSAAYSMTPMTRRFVAYSQGMKKKAISGSRRAYILFMRILMGAAAVITAALVLFLIAYVLVKGLPNWSAGS